MRRLSFWVSPALILSSLVSRPAWAQESIILMPDTQYYSKFSGGVRNVGGELETGHWGSSVPNVYERQILYANQEDDVKAVIHLGDITHYNHPAEWAVALAAESQLDPSIAHTLITGNHDYPYRFEDEDPLYRETPIEEIFGWNFWAAVDEENSPSGYWGAQRENANGDALPGPLNSYAKFDLNGEPYAVVSLEFAPRKESLCWANDVIENELNNRAIIIATHCYLNAGVTKDEVDDSTSIFATDGERHDCTEHYRVIGADGEDLWRELASRHNNVRFVVAGHVGGAEHVLAPGEHDGHQVWQILADYQFERNMRFSSNESHQNYGNGWMQKFTFDPSGEVHVDTFSVLEEDYFFDGQFNLLTTYGPDVVSHDDNGEGWHRYTMDVAPYSPAAYLGPSDLPPLERIRDFTVNTTSSGEQRYPAVAASSNYDGEARFRPLWVDTDSDDGDVRGRPLRGDGCHATTSDRAEGSWATRTSGQQHEPDIAMNASGDTVVVWVDKPTGEPDVILARGFRADGSQWFPERQVNVFAAGAQDTPSVAMNDAGEFVVVWADDNGGDGEFQIYGARFDANGDKKEFASDFSSNPAFDPSRPGDFTVNTITDGDQKAPRVAMDPDGTDFVVVWQDNRDENAYYQIYAAGYREDEDGRLVKKTSWTDGPEWDDARAGDITVNAVAEGTQTNPDVAMNSGGYFAVVWESNFHPNYQILKLGSRYTAQGQVDSYLAIFDPNGESKAEKRLGETAVGHQARPRVEMSGIGPVSTMIVTWQDDTGYDGWWQVKAQRASYAELGPLHPPLSLDEAWTVNSVYHGQQMEPSVALSVGNQAMFVWSDDVDMNDHFEIVAASHDVLDPQPDEADIPSPFRPIIAGGALLSSFDAIQKNFLSGPEPSTLRDAILMDVGFSEIQSPPFPTNTADFTGSSIALDVFLAGTSPSGYQGALQLYLQVPGAGLYHAYLTQKELSGLPTNTWLPVELDLPQFAIDALRGDYADAQISITTNSEYSGSQRIYLTDLRWGGDLEVHPFYDCATPKCLAACGANKEDCDDDEDNGCEIDTSDDPTNCGGCGIVCETGSCSDGTCDPTPQTATDCNAQNSIDLGQTGAFLIVPTNACLKIDDGVPSWWGTARTMKVQATASSEYPLQLQWRNACAGGSGSHSIDMDWDDLVAGPTSAACPTYLKLNGSDQGSVNIRYYGQ